jgi:hypothetical protein
VAVDQSKSGIFQITIEAAYCDYFGADKSDNNNCFLFSKLW